MKLRRALLALAAVPLLAGCAAGPRVRMVRVPLTDLRAEPRTGAAAGTHDPLQETQLLYGERVRVRRVKDGWAQVEALEQAEFTHGSRWRGYPGWVPEQHLSPAKVVWQPNLVITAKWAPVWRTAHRTSHPRTRLPMGSLVRGVNVVSTFWRVELDDGDMGWVAYSDARSLIELLGLTPVQRRQAVVETAATFIGDPYFWGGRSPHAAADVTGPTGVDCSSLVNLAYRSIGMIVPRDAHEQWLRARPVERLQPADLVFLSEPSQPRRIVHVMLYAGDGQAIEGPGTGKAVRRIALAQRLGRPADALRAGDVVDGQTVSFGSFLP